MTSQHRAYGLIWGVSVPMVIAGGQAAVWFRSSHWQWMIISWIVFGSILWGILSINELMRHANRMEKTLQDRGIELRD